LIRITPKYGRVTGGPRFRGTYTRTWRRQAWTCQKISLISEAHRLVTFSRLRCCKIELMGRARVLNFLQLLRLEDYPPED
jgi:hypothetical protein